MNIDAVIRNNRTVPFVRLIMRGKFNIKLLSAVRKDAVIVFPSNLTVGQAIRKNNYVEFDNQADADFFVDNYLDYNKPRKPEEMDQRRFEEWRQSGGNTKRYTITVEQIK